MARAQPGPVDALILALPETAGSSLYGMVDVLAATGTVWRELVGEEPGPRMIQPRIVSETREPFTCGNAIPVHPELSFSETSVADILIIPELWLAPTDDLSDRYAELKEWIRHCYQRGSTIYTACSGSILLATTGLLDGREATSHWGYQDLFRRSFPSVRFNPQPSLVVADPAARIVTAGGTTSWHDLALHIVARHCHPGEALRIAKVYLLKWHSEGQLPFASLVRRQPHADSVVRRAEDWLTRNFREPNAVSGVVSACSIPERTLKRRFKAATGAPLLVHVQNLRIEEAKRLLEATATSADEIAALVGYDNPAFFRRLFKRFTGLTPGAYRRLFRPQTIAAAAAPIGLPKLAQLELHSLGGHSKARDAGPSPSPQVFR
ncbi:GlxA family transcriptional regulator [Aquibaculum sediminis]|uniref:GlxA family transcriptional regulator n=1 Tax=Aquibaculum sediminis TaxID=3231907 RepID=UPI00345242B7